MWAVKSNGTIYRWNGSGWTLEPGLEMLISVGSASQIWGLSSDTQIWKWNGTGWASQPGRLSYISAAADGTVLGVSSNRQVWQWNGTGWSVLSGLLDEVSVGGKYEIYGRSGTSVWTYVNSAWTQITSAPAASDIAANQDGGLWIRGTNSTTYYSLDMSTWQSTAGAMVMIGSGGKYQTVGVGSNGVLYHLNNLLPIANG